MNPTCKGTTKYSILPEQLTFFKKVRCVSLPTNLDFMQGREFTIFSFVTGMGIRPAPGAITNGLQVADRLHIHQPTWYFIYLFLLAGLIAWIRMYYGHIFIQTFQAATNFQATSKMYNDNSLLKKQLDRFLHVLYFLSIAFTLLVLELRIGFIPFDLKGGWLLLLNLGLLSGLFLFRVVLHTIAGALFNCLGIVREYLYNMFVFNKLLGLSAVPLMFLLLYTPEVLQRILFWAAVSVFSIIIFMRLIRGMVFSYRKYISIFYMFLYLCALEISPLVLLYRWLEGLL